MQAIGLVLGVLLVAACARQPEIATPAPSRAAANDVAAPATSNTDASPSTPPRPATTERLREPPPPALRELPRALPDLTGSRPPKSCARLTAGPLSERRTACGATMAADLARALGLSDLEQRDRALTPLEPCNELPAGWLRAVRADLARQCADVLITPALRALKGPLDADLGEALLGLALAARWGRAVETLAPYTGSGAEDSIARYLNKILRPWKQRQLAKIQTLSGAASQLDREGYGVTVVELARARATHQLLSVIRSSPIPKVVKRDYALRTRYFAMLDSELLELHTLMVREDARARELLFEQGIHRAADADEWFELQRPDFANLRIEPPPSVQPLTDAERIIGSLPSVYAEALFGTTPLDDARQLRLMVEHGLTPGQRRALAVRHLVPESSEILAYFHAALAMRTRRLEHFDQVVGLLQSVTPRSPAAELLLATALAFRTAERPLDAQSGEPTSWNFDVGPLRALADAAGPARERAFALNNAAWLSVLANTPDSLRAAEELASRARALAPTDPCLRPLYSPGFLREDASRPCELPLLP